MQIKSNRLVHSNGEKVHFVETPNEGGDIKNGGKPSVLVIHYTAGGSAKNTVSFMAKSSAKVSAHLVIGRDGDITQMVKFNRRGWHAGKSRWRGRSNLNDISIGIELANFGLLKKTGAGSWVSHNGHHVASENVILEEHKHRPGTIHGWEAFTEAQIDACLEVSQTIVEEYGIEPWDVVGHDDISIHRKIDPGPAFDMDQFRSRVFGRGEDSWNDDIFKVDSPSGLNMRKAPALLENSAIIKELADGTLVHRIEKVGTWWLVAEVVEGNDDVTGYVHSNFLMPA